MTSGSVVRNFTGGRSKFMQMAWINGTNTFAALYNVSISEWNQELEMSLWNISQPDPIKTLNISHLNFGGADAPYYFSQVQDSTDYVVIAGGSNTVQVAVMNIWTGEYTYDDQYDLYTALKGFALNQNRYSYAYSKSDEDYNLISYLIVYNPKIKSMTYNISIKVNMTSFVPQFNCLSAFNSKLNGNNLIASLTNGTLLILDTLDNEILGSHTFPNGNFELTGCYSINDEVQTLMYCHQFENITILSGTNPEIIDQIEVDDSRGGFINIPESQQILFMGDQSIKSWKYQTKKTEIVIS